MENPSGRIILEIYTSGHLNFNAQWLTIIDYVTASVSAAALVLQNYPGSSDTLVSSEKMLGSFRFSVEYLENRRDVVCRYGFGRAKK